MKQRASSPKLVLRNNALIHAMSRRTRQEVQADDTWRGRLVENAVGAHLLCHLSPLEYSVHYWRQGDAEVDSVVARPGRIWALEIKHVAETLGSDAPDIREGDMASLPGKEPLPKTILAERPGKLYSRQMEATVKSPDPAGKQIYSSSAGPFLANKTGIGSALLYGLSEFPS